MSSSSGGSQRRRSWSDFGEIRRLPSEYEIVTHNTNWTLRSARASALEANFASPGNLWLLTYRDRSALQLDDSNAFRDPDELTYRRYVTLQDEQETIVSGLLERYAEARHDSTLSVAWRKCLAMLFCPMRYPMHAMQMAYSYFAYMAPSSYISNCGAFAAADMLRRVSLLAYRTRELQFTWPADGFGATERSLWETDRNWQESRKAFEFALIAYDWGECFCAVNLVLRPTIEDILERQLGELARRNGDELTWLILSNLSVDSGRCSRWSAALARFATKARAENREVLQKWISKWSPRADAAAVGLAELMGSVAPGAVHQDELVRAAIDRRRTLLQASGLESS